MVKRKSKVPVFHKPNVELLTEDEWMARRNTYMQRLADLKTSVALIDDAIDEHKELLKQQLKEEKWNNYLACDGLPNPNRPAEIRKFIFQLKFLEKESCTGDISWLLPVDEHSILSHAPDRKDMTRRNLEDTRPNIGQLYGETVQRILETIRRVERVLRNDNELLRLPNFQILELDKATYYELRSQLGWCHSSTATQCALRQSDPAVCAHLLRPLLTAGQKL
ncbi:uncharacterized protein [Drosophila takahashii]|uniref:uncharacterized protein isoform X4 n=1 Tax=Drosophila takahashii TaxID=29030 RepID=UPI001CF83A5A|nr:uncharacterized protein LOC123002362 [Drosophila takahashii]